MNDKAERHAVVLLSCQFKCKDLLYIKYLLHCSVESCYTEVQNPEQGNYSEPNIETAFSIIDTQT